MDAGVGAFSVGFGSDVSSALGVSFTSAFGVSWSVAFGASSAGAFSAALDAASVGVAGVFTDVSCSVFSASSFWPLCGANPYCTLLLGHGVSYTHRRGVGSMPSLAYVFLVRF